MTIRSIGVRPRHSWDDIHDDPIHELIHALAAATAYVRYGTAHWFFESASLDRYPFTRPPGWGYSLPVVYALWAFVVVSLYPACRWFSELKARNRTTWLSYL